MAKTSKIVKNNKRKLIVKKFAAKKAELNEIIRDSKASYEDKQEAMKKIRKLPRDSSRTRIVNRCHLTGRPRGFYRKFGLCRLELRKKAMFAQLPGVTKSSW